MGFGESRENWLVGIHSSVRILGNENVKTLPWAYIFVAHFPSFGEAIYSRAGICDDDGLRHGRHYRVRALLIRNQAASCGLWILVSCALPPTKGSI